MSDENLLDYRPEQSDDRAIGGRNDPWRAARSHPLRCRVERFKDRIAPDGYGNDSLASTLHNRLSDGSRHRFGAGSSGRIK